MIRLKSDFLQNKDQTKLVYLSVIMKVDLVTCLLVLLVSGHVSTGFWLQPSHCGMGYKVKTLSSDSCEGRCDKCERYYLRVSFLKGVLVFVDEE